MIPNLCRLPVVFAIVVVLELLIIAHSLGLSSIARFDWPHFSLLSLYAQLIALPSVWLLCLIRGWLNRISISRSTLIVLLLVMAVTAGVNLLFTMIAEFDVEKLLRDLCIVIVITGLGLRYCFVQQRWLLEQRSNQQARFAALQARIQPHFLFNTMNSIASLVRSDVDKAEQAIEDLSELLRQQINVDQALNHWSVERQLCEAYLRIESLRYGERLRVEWDVGCLPDDFLIPPLLIQPLIENSVKHGIAPSVEKGVIKIHASLHKATKNTGLQYSQNVNLIIENTVSTEFRPYAGSDSPMLISEFMDDANEGHGMALVNVHARLRSTYRNPDTGDEYASLRVEQPSGRYRVLLTLPLCTPDALPVFGADR